MLRVGLTGSIGVGKSFVSGILAELGCHVIDADLTAREVVTAGSKGLEEVAREFGAAVLNADGSLDRARLGAIVFADEGRRSKLNAILHPHIIARQDELMREWEAIDPNGIAIVDAALMIESGGYKRFDKLIVVHCRPEVQIERLMLRNNLTEAEAQQRIRAQMSQKEKTKFANYLIDTSDGFDETREQTEKVYAALVKDSEEIQRKHAN